MVAFYVDLSIHFPLTREDTIPFRGRLAGGLSIHFPLTREDHSRRRRPAGPDLSIHFPLTREDLSLIIDLRLVGLSIHFPLTREDSIRPGSCFRIRSFNPLPSHEGRRGRRKSRKFTRKSFNPLPSHEGRRHSPLRERHGETFQSTSLSRGKTAFLIIRRIAFFLSIHFPLTREDG